MEPSQTGFFQVLNIATKINKGAIEILSDVKVITAGEKVTSSAATLLAKMGFTPFFYGLEAKMVYDNGNVYDVKPSSTSPTTPSRRCSARVSRTSPRSPRRQLPHPRGRAPLHHQRVQEHPRHLRRHGLHLPARGQGQGRGLANPARLPPRLGGGGGGGGAAAKAPESEPEEEEEEEEWTSTSSIKARSWIWTVGAREYGSCVRDFVVVKTEFVIITTKVLRKTINRLIVSPLGLVALSSPRRPEPSPRVTGSPC